MKAAVLYYSKTGNTKKMAEVIADAMMTVEGVEAKALSIEEMDENWVKESKCVLLGSPVYYACTCEPIEHFLGTCGKYNLGGKIGGAFATANFTYGGGEMAIQNILTRMLFWGMFTYSGGQARGNPPIHMGPIAIGGHLDEMTETFRLYGQRMALATKQIFQE